MLEGGGGYGYHYGEVIHTEKTLRSTSELSSKSSPPPQENEGGMDQKMVTTT